jgi:DeoR family fructose operon transcriptional repressor
MKKEQVFVEERKRDIIEYVGSHKKATVAELCVRFGVSSATIRSDLRDLEQVGGLVRTHGGAMVPEKARFEMEAEQKETERAEEKRAIARCAISLIEDGDTIVIDTGSTTVELGRLLGEKNDITVLTNDFVIALELEHHPSAIVHLLGGDVKKKFHCTVGSRAEEMLEGLTVDKAFMGANGFSIERGGSTPDLQLAEVKRRMISIATKVYLLLDSSKFGRNSFVRFAPLETIDCIITESMSEEYRHSLEESGVDVLMAPMDSTTIVS